MADATPPQVIRFTAEGIADVKSAIASMKQANTDAARQADRERKESQRAAVQAAKEELAAYRQMLKDRAAAAKAAAKEEGEVARRTAAELKAAAKAAADEQKRAAREAAAAAKKNAQDDAQWTKERTKALAEYNKELAKANKPRDMFGNIQGAGGERGLRQISGSRAFDQIFGHTASQLLGLQGAGGMLLGAVNVFRSAIGLAAQALTSFGSFVLSDIIKPQLKLETTATQISNRIGGGSTGAGVASAINALYAKNPQADLDQITKAYGSAADLTKDQGKAHEVTDLALMANKAYGFDLNKMVEYIGKKRSALGSLSEDEFGALMSSQIAAGAKGSSSIEDLAGSVGKQESIAAKFGTYGGTGATFEKETQIASIINAATGKGMSGAQATTGLANLVEDLKRDPKKFGGMVGADGQLQRLDVILPKLIATAGGNLNAYAPGKKGGALADVQIGALSNGSRNFLDALQLGDTFKQAGGGAAGEKAVADKLAAIFDTANAGSKLLDDQKKVEATTSMQLEQAWRDLKVALTEAILPVLKTEGPKFATAIGDLAKGLEGVDLAGVFKAVAQGMAAALYGILSVVEMLPGVDGSKFAAAKGALGKIAGMNDTKTETADQSVNKKIQEGKGILDRPEFDSYDSNAKKIVSRYLPGLGAVMAGSTANTMAGTQADPLAHLKQQWGASATAKGGGGTMEPKPQTAAAAAEGSAFGKAAAMAFNSTITDPARISPIGMRTVVAGN